MLISTWSDGHCLIMLDTSQRTLNQLLFYSLWNNTEVKIHQRFRTYFQLLASESTLAYGYYGLIKKF